MTRPSDFLNVLDNPDAKPLQIDDAEGTLLLQLVVHIFFSDEHLDEREVELAALLVGDGSQEQLRERLGELGLKKMDFAQLASAFPDYQDRQDIITLAEHAWWADNLLEPGELDVADTLAEVLEIRER